MTADCLNNTNGADRHDVTRRGHARYRQCDKTGSDQLGYEHITNNDVLLDDIGRQRHSSGACSRWQVM